MSDTKPPKRKIINKMKYTERLMEDIGGVEIKTNNLFMEDDKYLKQAREILEKENVNYLVGTADCCLAMYLFVKESL